MALGFLTGLINKYFRVGSSLTKLSCWKTAILTAFKPTVNIMEGTGTAIE